MRALAILLAALLLARWPSATRRLEHWVFRAAELGGVQPVKLALAFGVIAFAGGALLEWSTGTSFPYIQDEFSYLLMADTFAEGRLANPTHALWPHFESFHILQRPTYASKYPPGQGIVLALGQVVFGHPIVGVWLSAAACAMCVYWMLLQWAPRRWAAIGAWIFLLKIGIVSYWSHSYWGGYAAAIGGALAAGSARRLADRISPSQGATFSIGAVILANSRPFEGLALSLTCAGYVLLRWLHKPPMRQATALGKTVLAALVPLAAGAVAAGIYNHAVTGDAMTMPYQLHQRTYHAAPVFLFQDPGPTPAYDLEPMRKLHLEELERFQKQRTLHGAIEGVRFKWGNIKSMFMPRGFGIVWLVIPFLFFFPSTRAPAVLAVLVVAASLTPNRFFPHYAAPYTGLFIVILVQALRLLRAARPLKLPVGRALVSLMLLTSVLVMLEEVVEFGRSSEPERIDRRAIARELYEDGGQHLVIVTYGPKHNPAREWVYNRADIDSAKVVWARDLGVDRSQRLLDYFPQRQVWSLFYDSGAGEVSLTPANATRKPEAP